MAFPRIPRRWRLRTLMVVVAISGLTIAAVQMEQRREAYYLDGYREHESLASRWADEKDYGERFSVRASREETRKAFKQYGIMAGALLDYHKQLASKYREAARYPWRLVGSVPPGPREPDDRPVISICD